VPKKVKKSEVKRVETKNFKVYNYLILVLFGAFIILITTFKISGDDDIFWHLETGRYIVDNKVVPSSDVFGFATAGKEWIPFEWGWDVLAYFSYQTGGYAGVSVLRTIFFVMMFYLLFKIISKFGLSLNISIIVFIILLSGIYERLLVKPQISSYLFFCMILYLLLDYRHSGRNSRKIFFLPLIFLVWTNMHMGVIAGAVIFSIFAISELIIYLKPGSFSDKSNEPVSRKQMLILAAVFFSSLLMLLLNPQGLHTYAYVYNHLQMKMMEDVFEWRSPFDKIFEGTIYLYIYYVFIAGSLVILYYSFKKKDLFVGLLIVVFTAFSFRSSRFSIDFMVVSAIFLIIAVEYIIRNADKKSFAETLISSPVIKIVIIVLISGGIVMLPGSKLYELMNFDRVTGFGVNTNDYPAGAVNFIKANYISTGSKPFNTYDCGGYLIWEIPGEKNFIDSRGLSDEIYYSYKALNYKMPGFEQKMDSYGFDYVLWFFPGLPMNTGEIQASIVSYLIKKETWKLVYWDDNSFVFVKNDPRFKDIIDLYQYKYANPYFYIFDKEPLKKATYDDPKRIIEEVQRNYRLNPDGVFIRSMARSLNIPLSR